MSIFRSPYDTAINQGFDQHPLIGTLKVSLAARNLVPSEENERLYVLTNDYHTNKEIPSFEHPIVFTYDQREIVAVDARVFCRQASPLDPLKIVNQAEYDICVARGDYTVRAIYDKPKALLLVNSLPLAAFSSWVAGALTSKLSLDMNDEKKIRILAAFYYVSLFNSQEKLNEQERHTVIGMISRFTRISADQIVPVIADLDYIKDVNDFCRVVRDVTDSVRTRSINGTLLLSVVTNTWYGVHAKKIVAVALEHPPTWLALVLACVKGLAKPSSAIYRLTPISKNVERIVGKNGAGQIVQALEAARITDI